MLFYRERKWMLQEYQKTWAQLLFKSGGWHEPVSMLGFFYIQRREDPFAMGGHWFIDLTKHQHCLTLHFFPKTNYAEPKYCCTVWSRHDQSNILEIWKGFKSGSSATLRLLSNVIIVVCVWIHYSRDYSRLPVKFAVSVVWR